MAFQPFFELGRPTLEKSSKQQKSKSMTSARRSLRRVAGAFTSCLGAIKSFVLLSTSTGQQRTHHAMRFLLATEGRTFEQSLAEFRKSASGRDLLQRRPDFRSLCCNPEMLKSCPSESLGYWYSEFMARHGLDEDHYLGMATEQGERFAEDPGRAWFHTRVDASHDIRHVLSGYRPDVLGEVCLLWFRFGQIRHFGILALALLGSVSLVFTQRGPVIAPLWEAYSRGHRAGLLDQLPWEDGFALPLSAHRAAL